MSLCFCRCLYRAIPLGYAQHARNLINLVLTELYFVMRHTHSQLGEHTAISVDLSVASAEERSMIRHQTNALFLSIFLYDP